MSKIYSYLLQPGETHDNHICLDCDKDLQENIKQNLKSNAMQCKFPTVIAKFSNHDETIIYDFLKRNQISGGLFSAVYNTYVDTKLSLLLLAAMKQSNSDKYEEIKRAVEIFKSGNFNDFRKFYILSTKPEGILSQLNETPHSFEVNIFEEEVSDIFLQRSINNLISAKNNFAVKIFSDGKILASQQDSSGHKIEAPNDYILVKLKCGKNNEIQL